MRLLLFISFLLMIPNVLPAQVENTLSLEEFISIVRNHHPIIREIELLEENSESVMMNARGAFDPVLKASLDNKNYEEKNYFERYKGLLTVPTILAADFYVNYESNEGEFLNNSELLPENGLIGAGVNLPLLQGLLFDERRKILQEAKQIRNENKLRQVQRINMLLSEAIESYIGWQWAFNTYQRHLEIVNLADIRLENTKDMFGNGASPAVDTLESYLNVIQKTDKQKEIEQKLIKSIQKVNNFLWLDGYIPTLLEDDVIPTDLDIDIWQDKLTQTQSGLLNDVDSNPELQILDVKQSILRLDRRLQKENLKPKLNLNFQALLDVDQQNNFIDYQTGNYKLGLDFSYPLFTRKERSDIALTDIKIEELSLKQKRKRQELQTKLINSLRQINLFRERLDLVNQNIQLSRTLLSLENEKYSIGESSIFLLNQRESNLLEGFIQELDLKKDILGEYIQILVLTNSIDNINDIL